jgi:hypothetical protein
VITMSVVKIGQHGRLEEGAAQRVPLAASDDLGALLTASAMWALTFSTAFMAPRGNRAGLPCQPGDP